MAVSGDAGGAKRREKKPAAPAVAEKLSHPDKLELYYWMRLTRTLVERLVNLHRQN